MTLIDQIAAALPRRTAPGGALRRLARLAAVARERRALAGLSDHLLDDVGLTRAEAQREAARPVWDAPEHWHRRR